MLSHAVHQGMAKPLQQNPSLHCHHYTTIHIIYNTMHTGERRLFFPQAAMVSWKISQIFQITIWLAVSNLSWNCVLQRVASAEGEQRALSLSCTDTHLQTQSYQLLRCIWEMNALHLSFYYTWMHKEEVPLAKLLCKSNSLGRNTEHL